jgi:DNA-binding transcriptional LysR family regulator
MGLDIGRLRVLVEVAHAGSIAAAARRMGFTASALSQQLAQLEREVGDHLVVRGPTGVRLTAAGTTLVGHGERVLGALHDAEDAIAAAPRDHLSIGTFASAAKALLPAALATFRRDHPHVRLTLLDIEPPDGYGPVTSGDLDLLITHRYPDVALPPAGGLRRERLMTDRLRLVLPAGHRFARRRRLSLTTLADEEWISGRIGVPNRVALDAASRRAGIGVRVAYETQDYTVTLALVGAGIGVALVPHTTLPAHPDGYVVGDLDKPSAREIFLVHRPRPRPPLSGMISLIRDATAAVSPTGWAG